MFHGGTNFGFTAGANFSDKYQPDVTSYDYDAPLDEAGRPTPKYFAIRDLLARYQPKGTVLPGSARALAGDHHPGDRVRRERLRLRQPAAGRPERPARSDGVRRPEQRASSSTGRSSSATAAASLS